MKKILFFAFFLVAISTFSQRVKGVVLDAKTKKPIVEAHLDVASKIYITSKKGEFSFLSPKNWNKKIQISHISYKTKTVEYQQKELVIYLEPRSEALKEVLLVGNRGNDKLAYETLEKLPKRVHSFASLMHNDKIYVFGGDRSVEKDAAKNANEVLDDPNASVFKFAEAMARFPSFNMHSDELYIYDFQTEQWVTETTKFRKRANHSAALFKDKIYLIGGKRYSLSKKKEFLENKIEVYDINTKKVQIDHANPHQAVDLETIVYKDRIYVLGGSIKKKSEGNIKYSDKIHEFQPKTGLWFQLSEIPFTEETTTCLVNDKIYFFDGLDKNKSTNTIVTLDLKTGQISKEGTLFYNLNKPAITKSDDTIYLFENRKILTYNTKTKELKDYRIDLSLYAAKMYVRNEELYILGGFQKDGLVVRPQDNLYKVDLTNLPKTKVRRYAKF